MSSPPVLIAYLSMQAPPKQLSMILGTGAISTSRGATHKLSFRAPRVALSAMKFLHVKPLTNTFFIQIGKCEAIFDNSSIRGVPSGHVRCEVSAYYYIFHNTVRTLPNLTSLNFIC